MRELNRLEWKAGIAFTSHGSRFGIRVNDPALLERIPSCLPPGSRPSTSEIVDYLYSLRVLQNGARPCGPRYELYTNKRLCLQTEKLNDLLCHLEHFLGFKIALVTRHKLFVHAGVVGWKGRAIVIPGRSRSGKTSLVRALVRAGALYYSDEYAVFDACGRVHPYARPLHVREEGSERRRCTAEELGGCSGDKALLAGLIVSTEYQAGALWHPSALSPGHAMLALLDNTVSARIRPYRALATLQRVVPHTPAFQGVRGEAEAIATVLLKKVEESLPDSSAFHDNPVFRRTAS